MLPKAASWTCRKFRCIPAWLPCIECSCLGPPEEAPGKSFRRVLSAPWPVTTQTAPSKPKGKHAVSHVLLDSCCGIKLRLTQGIHESGVLFGGCLEGVVGEDRMPDRESWEDSEKGLWHFSGEREPPKREWGSSKSLLLPIQLENPQAQEARKPPSLGPWSPETIGSSK